MSKRAILDRQVLLVTSVLLVLKEPQDQQVLRVTSEQPVPQVVVVLQVLRDQLVLQV
jgi:Tfp pilus assembly protein FimV